MQDVNLYKVAYENVGDIMDIIPSKDGSAKSHLKNVRVILDKADYFCFADSEEDAKTKVNRWVQVGRDDYTLDIRSSLTARIAKFVA